MSPNAPAPQRASPAGRFRAYIKHVGSTLLDAPFAAGTWIYLAIVLVGVAAATWVIPTINGSATHAETLGIYVIGILIAVFADALFLWKKSKDDQIAETILVLSFLLIFCAGYLSVKETIQSHFGAEKRWRLYGEPALYVILLISILMWAMLNVVEPRLNVAATQSPPDFNHLSGS